MKNDDRSRVLIFPVKVESGRVLMDAGALLAQPKIEDDEEEGEENVA